METFSIQFVSQITGINGHTIRAWEKRYSAVVPKRDKNKRRLYTQEDIDRLKKIHDLCSLGNSVSDIAVLADNELESFHGKYFNQLSSAAENSEALSKQVSDPIDINSTLQNLMLAITHYKLDIISHELDKAKNSLSARQFALNLVIPLLIEIGMHVNNGFITVGMEHAITAIVRFHLGQMLFKEYQSKGRVNYQVILATPEKEFNDFSAMISTLLCSHYKLKFTYLGTNMSSYVLADASKQIKADMVILSVSKGYYLDNKGEFAQYLNNFVEKADQKTRVWITGINQVECEKCPIGQLEFMPTLQILDRKLSEIL